MTAVTIRPTFRKDSRPNNGLEDIAEKLQADKTKLFRVVGTVKYAGASVSEDGVITPASKFVTLEVVIDPIDASTVDLLIDERRKERGLGIAEDIPATGQLSGQQEFSFNDADDEEDGGEGGSVAETRMGPDGEHEVPPPSGEEILAERDEAKAAGRKAKPSTKPFEAPDGGDAA